MRFAASERLGFWLSAGTAGREPARNDLLQGEDDVAQPVDLEAVRPERLLDLELGADWRSARFDLSAVLYAMEFEDEIAATGEQSDLGYAIRRNLPYVMDHVARRSLLRVHGGFRWKFDRRIFAQFFSHAIFQFFEKAIMNSTLDQHVVGSDAGLSGIKKLAPNNSLGRDVE